VSDSLVLCNQPAGPSTKARGGKKVAPLQGADYLLPISVINIRPLQGPAFVFPPITIGVDLRFSIFDPRFSVFFHLTFLTLATY